MIINVNDLKKELNTFNNLIKEYEDNYLNYYNVISSFSFFWNDAHSDRFYNAVTREKINVINSISNLKSLRNAYKYLVEKYSLLGQKIKIDIDERKNILNKFDSYIDRTNDVIQRYYNLDLSFCPEIAYRIREQRSILETNNDRAVDARDKIRKIYNDVENIEKQMRTRISKIDVRKVVETNINGMY